MFPKKQGSLYLLDMKECIKYFLLFVLLVCAGLVSAQNRSELEKKRNDIIQEIELTSKNLEKTTSNKKTTIGDLKAIENQIKNRKKLIQNIKDQLKSADSAIANNENRIDSLNVNLGETSEQYRVLAKNMYIRELSGNKWAYIFSADGVNDAFLRWRYSKQYETFATQKTSQVKHLKGSINNKNNSILEEKSYVQKLLEDEKKNYASLEYTL